MKPAGWRAALLILCAAGALLTGSVVLDQTGFGVASPWFGMWGAFFNGSSEPYNLEVTTVDPGGPADRAGVRAGDLIDIRGLRLRERLSLLGQELNARRISFTVRRAASQERVDFSAGPIDLSRFWNYVLSESGSLWLLLFAALIAWRRPYAGGNLLLSTILACVAIATVSGPGFSAWPWTWPYVALPLVGLVGPTSYALLAALASGFARPLSPVRRIALVLCCAFAAVNAITGNGAVGLSLGFAPLVATITGWFDPIFFFRPIFTAPGILATFAALSCCGLAVAASRGVERHRAAWSLVPLAALYASTQLIISLIGVLPYQTVIAVAYVSSATFFITPVVLTYVALSRRLIDIGFVMNRTIVFAAVSTIVVGAFVLVEWAASEWLVNASHTTSVVIGMVVALGLGLSLRYIHKYVDRFVDRVFFRKRHDDEAALRRFAHEASYISDRSTLLDRAVDLVKEHTTARDAAILVRDGSASYAFAANGRRVDVSQDDPAIVALRAWHKPVDLQHLRDSALSGEFAFPMISRGELIGTLVCGQKRDGEAYAPDESDALQTLAHGVGAALALQLAERDRSSDLALILRELAEMRQVFARDDRTSAPNRP